MATDKPFLSFVIDKTLRDVIDEYRFDNKIDTRAEAIRDLIRAGLTAKGYTPPQ